MPTFPPSRAPLRAEVFAASARNMVIAGHVIANPLSDCPTAVAQRTALGTCGRLPRGRQVVDDIDNLGHFARWPPKIELLDRPIRSVAKGPQSSVNERATHFLPDACFRISARQLMIRRQLSYLRRDRLTCTAETIDGESVHRRRWYCGAVAEVAPVSQRVPLLNGATKASTGGINVESEIVTVSSSHFAERYLRRDLRSSSAHIDSRAQKPQRIDQELLVDLVLRQW